jgi:hypothetical protein
VVVDPVYDIDAGVQLNVVVVVVWMDRLVALLVELEAWVVSPPYEADIE